MKRWIMGKLGGVLGLLLLLAASANAQVDCSSGFTTTSGPCGVGGLISGSGSAFKVTGSQNGANPAVSGSRVLLMPQGASHAALSLTYQTQVDVRAFTANWTFVPNGENVVFMLQNSNNNGTFNGNSFSAGAGCEADYFQGYGQPNPPNNVFALVFDSVNPVTNGAPFTYSTVQIYKSSPYSQCPCMPSVQGCGDNNSWDSTPITKISTAPVPLNSPANQWLTTTGDTYNASLAYDGSNLTLNLYNVTTGDSCPGPRCFTNTWSGVNIPSSVGSTSAWAAFGGSTRNAGSANPLYISSFVYSPGVAPATPKPPTPTPTATATATATVTATPTPNPTPPASTCSFTSPLGTVTWQCR